MRRTVRSRARTRSEVHNSMSACARLLVIVHRLVAAFVDPGSGVFDAEAALALLELAMELE